MKRVLICGYTILYVESLIIKKTPLYMISLNFSQRMAAPKSQLEKSIHSQRKFQGTRKAMHAAERHIIASHASFLYYQRSNSYKSEERKKEIHSVHVHGGIFM